MARGGKEFVKVERDNRKSLDDFQKAIEAAVKAHSRYALSACKTAMLEEAVRQAEFNNYSGTLIRSYLATMVAPRQVEIKNHGMAPSNRVSKGNGITEIYNRTANIIRRTETELVHESPQWSSSKYQKRTILHSGMFPSLMLGGRLRRARKVSGGFLKKLTYVRSHEEPKTILSKYDTDDGTGAIKRYTTKGDVLSKMHGAVNRDYVILTNGAPYAEEVHRKWNRVLPGELPEYTRNFYLKRLRKVIEETAKRHK